MIDIERDAIELAKLTPASGWDRFPDPATACLPFTKAELEARLRRAYRQLVGHSVPMTGVGRQPDETHQQWADRIGAMGGYPGVLLHTMRVAYLNLEALS
jgi:hypothetical protein